MRLTPPSSQKYIDVFLLPVVHSLGVYPSFVFEMIGTSEVVDLLLSKVFPEGFSVTHSMCWGNIYGKFTTSLVLLISYQHCISGSS